MTLHLEPPAAAQLPLSARIRPVRSPGGVEAWLFEDRSLPSLSMSFGFRGGALLDPPGRAGAAAMMTNLLTQGAGTLDAAAFGRALGDHAIRLSFTPQRDTLLGHLQTLTHNADRAFDLLRLALHDPSLTQDVIERVRGRMAAGIRRALSEPEHAASQSFFAHGFAGHAHARPVGGDLASLDAIDRDTLVALHRRAITRGNLLVAVVGAIDPARLEQVLDRIFADLPEDAVARPASVSLGGLGERTVTRLSLPQSTIYFGRPGIRRDDPDFIAAHLVNHCLGGGGFTSRLMREVRIKRGLCYGIWTGLSADAASCTFLGSTSVANAKVEETLAVITEECRLLAREGLAAGELERAKSYMIGIYGQNFDTSVSISTLLRSLQLEGRAASWLDERARHILAVTRDDTARVIERLLGDGAMLTTIAGDPAQG